MMYRAISINAERKLRHTIFATRLRLGRIALVALETSNERGFPVRHCIRIVRRRTGRCGRGAFGLVHGCAWGTGEARVLLLRLFLSRCIGRLWLRCRQLSFFHEFGLYFDFLNWLRLIGLRLRISLLPTGRQFVWRDIRRDRHLGEFDQDDRRVCHRVCRVVPSRQQRNRAGNVNEQGCRNTRAPTQNLWPAANARCFAQRDYRWLFIVFQFGHASICVRLAGDRHCSSIMLLRGPGIEASRIGSPAAILKYKRAVTC